jgi:peptide/nickel transport system ATP-binding protein
MGAVAEMADRVVVMYAGRVVEEGLCDQVLGQPGHPYTRGLIDCLPELGSSQQSERQALAEIAGMVPSIWELDAGCAFRARCPQALERCAHALPPMFALPDSSAAAPHRSACWLHQASAA